MTVKEKAKQQKLPGFTEIKDDRIEEAADAYVEARDKRMELTKDEVTTQDALIAAVQKNSKVMGLIAKNPKGKIRVGDHILTLKDITKIGVKKVKETE